jgi:hypothetical protein
MKEDRDTQAGDLEFSYRSARSAAFTWGIVGVIAIESVAVHFAIAARFPRVAWAVTLGSLLGALWIIRDYAALGSGAVRLSDDALHLRIGRRFDFAVPLLAIDRALAPTFRDLPTPGTNQGRDYLNLTKPSQPNVLIVLADPQRVRLTAGLHRDVRRVALRLDDGPGFLAALESRRTTLRR